MANNKQIHNVAIVGTGVIGASWAALYLARGLNVTATDPAPDAEDNLRRYIDAAWKDLIVIGLSKNASRDHLKFTTDLKKALADARIEVADEREAVIVDLHDKPGAMGEIARDLAEAGVNIDVAYTIFTGVRLVILTEDVEAAREALDLNGASG